MKKVLFVGSVLLLAAGWGFITQAQQTPTTPTPKPSNPTAKPTQQRPIVELLSIGAEPRQTLRFKPALNSKQIGSMIMKMDMGLSIAGKAAPRNKVPATVMTFETTVNQIDSNGNIHYQFRYTQADLVGDSSVPPAALKELRAQLQNLKGISGTVVVDNRGQTQLGKFNLPQSLDSKAKLTLKQISRSVEQLSAPLPEPAIGLGAKWRVTTSPTIGGIRLTQSATYELIKLQDDRATLRVVINQQAPAQQPIEATGLPKNASFTLKSLSGSGQGQTDIKLDRLIPLYSSMVAQSNSVMEVANVSTKAPMTMETDTKMELTLKSK
jgi:hypothetical protein